MQSKLSNTNTCSLNWKTTALLLLSQHFQSAGKQQGWQDKSLPKETPCQTGFTSKFLKSDLLQNRKWFLAPSHTFMGWWWKNQFQPRFGPPYCGMLYSEPLLSVRTLQSLQPRPALSRERHEGAWQRVGKAHDDALQRCKILQAVRISLPHLLALLFEPDIA